jgi:two-component system response regulator MprA
MHLLLVEDDARLARALARLLRDDRHVVDVAGDGASALDLIEAADGLDALILDVGLPDISGLEVARRVRSAGSSLAILMLTARDAIGDRVAGLDAGADDYLVKPFAYDELSARLRALGRRAGGAGSAGRSPARRLASGTILLDETTRRVTVDDNEIELSRQEFALLECLLRNPGRVLSRDELLDRAWPVGAALTPNAVEVYVHYLRTKLGSQGWRIETVRGVGYRLAER